MKKLNLYSVYVGIPYSIALSPITIQQDIRKAFRDFPGYSYFIGHGIWEDTAEDSVKIEIVTYCPLSDIIQAAENIKLEWEQQAVLITHSEVTQQIV